MENKEEINVKKKKKAFTLIELLAIIVILAIIAVITVPIILNIIENSKKGAATDSAYGYKDAVNKAYIQELTKPDNGNLKLNGNYTVQSNALVPSTDNTFGFGVTNYNSLPVDVSGDKPSSGTLTYSNNVLTSGCLVIGDYAVTFNGNETSTVKGTCSASEQGNGGTTQNTVSPVVYTATWNGDERTLTQKTVTSENTLAVGDYVKLGENDGFYVVNPSRNGKVVLMSEYNITNTSSETGYNAPSNGIMLMSNRTYVADNTTSTWRQAYHEVATNGETIILPDEIYYTTKFSDDFYWGEKYGVTSDCAATYCPLYSGEEFAYIYDTNSNLYGPMEDYKDYLKNETGLELTVRPMSYSEANSINSNSWAYNQTYWLGSENGGNGIVWFVDSNGSLGSSTYDNDDYNYYNFGVRPVIEISTSAF